MKHRLLNVLIVVVFALALVPWTSAQTCASASELDAPVKSALESAVNQYFLMAQQGNVAGLQRASTPDFTEVANVVNDNKNAFTGNPVLQSVYLLDNASSRNPKQEGRTEFFCGIFNSPDRVGFVFPSLAPGTYAVAIQDTRSDKGAHTISWILQQSGNQWKIAGLIPKSTEITSHDGNWFIQQARTYKSKGQLHNAWFYYVTADELLRPFGAMSTPQLDKLYDEFQSVRPADLPANGPVPLIAAGKTYNVTAIFPTPVADAVYIVVKYQTPDLSDVSRTYQDNMAVIKAIVNKYPELRNAFAGIVARAVAPSGQDYGTLLAMKDVK